MDVDPYPLFAEPHPRIDVNIRWLVRRDMPEILRIERQCFKEFPWSEDQFVRELKARNQIGIVAESKKRGDVLGYMIYALEKSRLDLLNFAVKPAAWRFQVGTQMMDKLKSKLSRERRYMLRTMVRETNLAAQMFFRANGLRAVEVRRRYFDPTLEDAYQFEYWVPEVVAGLMSLGSGARGE